MKILAIDIGGTAIKVVELNEEGTILSTKEVASEAKKGGEYLMNKVISLIEEYNDYCSIGISTAGQVDAVNGKIIYANENIPNYTGMPVKDLIEEKFGVPVYVDNDVNAAALGEAHYGSGKDYNDFLCLTYGTGIGGAIIVDGLVYRGNNGVAGEFGHMLTHPNGKLCGCHMHGCYEQYASVTALIREASAIDQSYTNGKILFEKIHEDERIKQLIDKWTDEVVIGLINLVHVFNPSCIILGGGIMEQELIIEEIRRKIYNTIMPSYRQVQIAKAKLGNRAGALGVGYMAMNIISKKTNKY